MSGRASGTRSTGPRLTTGPRAAAPGPRLTAPQPATPPTIVQIGNDRMLTGAREVAFSQLAPDPDQPRKTMDPVRLRELADSIVKHGLLQPMIVRQAGLGADGDMQYIVVAGGRRLAAIALALETTTEPVERERLLRVPVVINDSEAAERRVLQLIENLQREDLNPIEEAHALKEIARIEGLTTTGLAGRVHRSQGYIDERLRLLRHEDVEEAVTTGLLTKSAGAAIASIPGADDRREWIVRAQRGEIVRAREVYASKPNRRPRHRRRAATPSGADPAALAALARRSRELRAANSDLTKDEAFHLAAVEAREAGQLDAATAARVIGARPDVQTAEQALPLPADLAHSGRDLHELAEEVVAIGQVRQTMEAARALRTRLEGLAPIAEAHVRQELAAELLALARAMQIALAKLTAPTADPDEDQS